MSEQTPRRAKRQRSASPVAGSSPPQQATPPPRDSLPPSSPPAPFSDTDDSMDERDADEDGEGIDLFADGHEKDYGTNELLDQYSEADINDDEDLEELSIAARRAADLKMDRRARLQGAGRRAQRRARGQGFVDDDDGMDDGDEDEEMISQQLSDIKAKSIVEWIANDLVRRSIVKHFRLFLTTYTDDKGDSVYGERIRVLGENNAESLEVSYKHLAESKPILAYFLATAPSPMLEIFDEVALDAILVYFPAYKRIHSEIHVRISDLPAASTLRDLRRAHLNNLVRVSGVVTRRSGVFPQLKLVKFNCGKCRAVLGPFYQDATREATEVKISFCGNCESKGPFSVNQEQTVYRNYQKMTLQESPGSVPAGRLPRHREVILLWDLIDSAKPGEEVEITGIYRNNFDASLNAKNGFPVFSTVIEANHVNKKEDLFAAFRLTEEDEKEMRALARDERIRKRIIKSIAPSIYGHEDIKTAIALSLIVFAGDINILLLGDPGTAKSQFLKYAEKTAHRSVFATGQGASAVGLTASVRKDPVTREWTLEGGALFDKMNDADRTSIHEAMEQQTISISKAGIVTTLQARCAVIAAANPIRGRYNPTIPFQQNVELTEPILSRFDVLCVVKDNVDPVTDELLARFVVGSHLRSHPNFEEEQDEMDVGTTLDADIIPQHILRKYIMYAREKVQPKLHALDQNKLADLFADLRRESLATGSFPITVRHLESMIRMAEASAKMALREYVRADDIDVAIEVAVGSFVNAQKMSIKKTLQRGFRKYLTQSKDHEELLAFLLGGLVKDKARLHQLQRHEQPELVAVKITELEGRAKDHDIFDITPFLRSKLFSTNGYTVGEGVIEKRFKRANED
ncbi:DNA helicase [Favolaschia claudopus]|uniref:DNA replication licensing factor MCM2 n=1 Tax=Favolaschia claudopus TaxID=2862362 RepID=A0AAW0A910_9AGAR